MRSAVGEQRLFGIPEEPKKTINEIVEEKLAGNGPLRLLLV